MLGSRGVWVVALAGVVGVVGYGGWTAWEQNRPLPPCPAEVPAAGAAGPRAFTAEERALVEQVVRADANIAKISGSQPLTVRFVPNWDPQTGVTQGGADVSWPEPVTAPAALFVGGADEDTPGRWRNLRRVLVSVDLERRAVYRILPLPPAQADGIKRNRGTCEADH